VYVSSQIKQECFQAHQTLLRASLQDADEMNGTIPPVCTQFYDDSSSGCPVILLYNTTVFAKWKKTKQQNITEMK